LEEELTRKEERWNVTFTRLKDKAETKEKECEGLQKQITVLEQEKIALWEKEVCEYLFSS
jgi:chaperonin cofactor prefoldin